MAKSYNSLELVEKLLAREYNNYLSGKNKLDLFLNPYVRQLAHARYRLILDDRETVRSICNNSAPTGAVQRP